MKVFKFGGASVKDADAVRNVKSVLDNCKEDQLVVVVSAMGKTTNALESLTNSYFNGETPEAQEKLAEIKDFHNNIIEQLFTPDSIAAIKDKVNNHFVEVEWAIEDAPTGSYDFEYDQIVSMGEIVSTSIIAAYLKQEGIDTYWLDARDVIKTDNRYREARIDWKSTIQNKEFIDKQINQGKLVITQGFIGCTSENFTTTLGREGSDFSAAILAHVVDAESVTIWKDVPGVLNADPKFYKNTVKLAAMTYEEAIELSYFGVSVIHPRTVQPLRNKNIPLYVRSFINFKEEGTVINDEAENETVVPCFIFKHKQTFLSLSPKDFSFIAEDHFKDIFTCFTDHNVKLNIIQNSAITFRTCFDTDGIKFDNILNELKKTFDVEFEHDLDLLTIRNYNDAIIKRMTAGKQVVLEQLSKENVRMILRVKI